MAKKPSPEKPAPSSLLPGFQHLIPSAAAAPLAAHIRPLFLPDLVQQIARNNQIDANRREQAHPAFRKWAKDLKQGVLQQLHETQVEQDFNHVLLRGLGYTTQSNVASDQPWTLTPKWNVPGSGEVDAALGKFRLDESGRLSGEPLVMVELKGAKVDLDRKMPTRNITPVQQVWNYLNASESAQWAIVCNYAEIRLYSRQKSSNHVHRIFLTKLDDPDKFAEFHAIFHADSLLGTGMFAQNTGWLLREGATKGGVRNCRSRMTSLRGGGLPGSFNLPRELRMPPLHAPYLPGDRHHRLPGKRRHYRARLANCQP